jgi:hypothetical protein
MFRTLQYSVLFSIKVHDCYNIIDINWRCSFSSFFLSSLFYYFFSSSRIVCVCRPFFIFARPSIMFSSPFLILLILFPFISLSWAHLQMQRCAHNKRGKSEICEAWDRNIILFDTLTRKNFRVLQQGFWVI